MWSNPLMEGSILIQKSKYGRQEILSLSSEPPKMNWIKHLQKHLTSQCELIFVPILIRAPNSDQLCCDWIFWNDASVGMVQKLNAHVCIHLGWARDWIIGSALIVLERTKQLDYATNYTEGFFHRGLTSTGYWDFVESHICHVCQSFLLTIVMLL